MNDNQPQMAASDVLELEAVFKQAGLDVIIDGGWGVDALLGRQTRPHSDLDIVIRYDDVTRLRQVLEAKGFSDVPRTDTREVNFVMGDDRGRLVDIHTYTLDRQNHPEQGLDYPLDSLNGRGTILGQRVRCIDAVNMVQFHTGYELDENDYRDVNALCLEYGIHMPDEYRRFESHEPVKLP